MSLIAKISYEVWRGAIGDEMAGLACEHSKQPKIGKYIPYHD